MFTGIVDHCGTIESIEEKEGNFQLTIATRFTDLELGESISIDGACLTVVTFENNRFKVQLSPETLRLTVAGGYEVGAQVNLERSLRLMDRLGGHFVTGHIDCRCEVVAINRLKEFVEMSFANLSEASRKYLVAKGSVALNGVSLTLNEVSLDGFKVMLIPHTLERTNLENLKVGSYVNVEYDYLAKLVTNQISEVYEI